MKVITCASYGGSGSSAITDLIAEYSDVCKTPEYEFRFLHDPDGISDLEFQLVECHNRHNAGRALKRFKNLCVFNAGNKFHQRYEPYFNNQYLELSLEYIEQLTDFTNREWWFYDILDKGEKYYYFKRIEDRILRLLTFGRARILKNEITFFSHPSEEKFLSLTQKYVLSLLNAMNKNNHSIIEIDQILPSQNIDRYLRYFDDSIQVDVFVVDRDPRDIYVLQKKYWRGHIDFDAETFVKRYRYERESGDKSKSKSPQIHYVQFEDLIFDYENKVSEIEKCIGLTHERHVDQFKLLNPQKSVINTQVWKDHAELEKDIAIIERELSEYLYPFERVDINSVPGISVSSTERF